MTDRTRALGDVTRASDAAPALRAIIAAEKKLLAQSRDESKGAEVVLALGRANHVLASIHVDPLRAGSMSPTSTIVPATRRVVADARALADRVC